MTLMELAVDNGKDQKNKNGDDSNGDYPIRSHPARVSQNIQQNSKKKRAARGSFKERGENQGDQYLRAMPLNVLILVST